MLMERSRVSAIFHDTGHTCTKTTKCTVFDRRDFIHEIFYPISITVLLNIQSFKRKYFTRNYQIRGLFPDSFSANSMLGN